MEPIHIPEQRHERDLLTFEQFCELIQPPARIVRDWRRRHAGPRWSWFEGCGRTHVAVAEVWRFVNDARPSKHVLWYTPPQGRPL